MTLLVVRTSKRFVSLIHARCEEAIHTLETSNALFALRHAAISFSRTGAATIHITRTSALATVQDVSLQSAFPA